MCIWKKMTAVEKMRKVWNFYRSIDPKMEEFLFSRWSKHPFFEEKGISIRSRVNLPMIFNRDTPSSSTRNTIFLRTIFNRFRSTRRKVTKERVLTFLSLSLLYTIDTLGSPFLKFDRSFQQIRSRESRVRIGSFFAPQRNIAKKKDLSLKRRSIEVSGEVRSLLTLVTSENTMLDDYKGRSLR